MNFITAWAALDPSGRVIINSVRDSRAGVRLAAGECKPVPVKITKIKEKENG